MGGRFDEISRAFGKLEQQNADIIHKLDRQDTDAATYRKEMREELKGIGDKVDKIDPLASRVTAMEPHVESYKNFRKQVAAAIIAASALFTGAVHLVWLGISNWRTISDAFKSLFGQH